MAINELLQTMVAPQGVAQRRALETQQTIQNPTNLMGVFTPNGIQARMARGDNVYMGGLPNAPGAGRPRNPTPNFGDISSPAMQAALERRIAAYGMETDARQARTARNGR